MDNEELLLYLLQLVQALRYEEPEFLCKMEDPSPLTTALEEPYSDGEEWVLVTGGERGGGRFEMVD